MEDEEQDEEEEDRDREKDGEGDGTQTKDRLLPERRSRRLKSEVNKHKCFVLVGKTRRVGHGTKG